MRIDNILFNLGEIILLLISMVFIYRIYLRSKRRIKIAYLGQFLAFVVLVINLVLLVFNEKGVLFIDIWIKLTNLLFLIILTSSYYFLQKSFTLAEQELKPKSRAFKIKFKRNKEIKDKKNKKK
jgi:hypothetical protein